MPYIKTEEAILFSRSKRYVFRIFVMRQIGTILCFFSISSVLYYLNYHEMMYILLASNTFVWPIAAYLYSKSKKDGIKTTNISLVIDAALGGIARLKKFTTFH